MLLLERSTTADPLTRLRENLDDPLLCYLAATGRPDRDEIVAEATVAMLRRGFFGSDAAPLVDDLLYGREPAIDIDTAADRAKVTRPKALQALLRAHLLERTTPFDEVAAAHLLDALDAGPASCLSALAPALAGHRAAHPDVTSAFTAAAQALLAGHFPLGLLWERTSLGDQVADLVVRRCGGDVDRLRVFCSLAPGWDGTLDELAEATLLVATDSGATPQS